MIKLTLEDKVIDLNIYEVDGKVLYKAQDLLKGYGLTAKQCAKKLVNWSENSYYPNTGIVKKEGRYGGTYLTKRNTLKLAGYVSVEFEDAVYDAFEHLTEGDTKEALSVAGSVAIDLYFAKKVEEKWKLYIKWAYSEFAEVNARYGGNMTKMVVRSATGVGSVKSIKGKADASLISRLVEQNNGSAINAINATLSLVFNYTRTKVYKEQMLTRDGKKQAYATLSQMLNWEED